MKSILGALSTIAKRTGGLLNMYTGGSVARRWLSSIKPGTITLTIMLAIVLDGYKIKRFLALETTNPGRKIDEC